ncbi:hypothetical protein CC80DRAFT_531506 [Byssothecium circinans]|uniref:Zn(2)-C6 fungal-type domain-containing protein n=1 Tax=Byssothecium circinans TaxID=147558 RepID=A0A6A5UKQ2_9PLEO|nr:hypothetical protein CC80DRAFT_531506 [Byssothecium circinans]
MLPVHSKMPNLYSLPRPKSCQHCAAAKVKCEPDFGSVKCKRCNKQNIDCVLKVPAPRKRRKQRHNPPYSSLHDGPPTRTTNSSPASSPTASAQIAEVQQGLEYYRRSLFQWLPFIQSPDLRQSVTEFIKAKPFLSLMIAMLGCTQDRARQRELAAQSRTWLAMHVFQKGEKSLDVLQGLLLATHWYTFQYELGSQRNLFLHLAMSMIVDLGLFKSPFVRRRIMTQEEAASISHPNLNAVTEHTLEQKRALLGCIYLTSAVTTASLSVEAAAHFSVYAEQCYTELEKSSLVSDQILAHLCHLQHIVEQFSAERSVLAKRHRRNTHGGATPSIADRYPGADGLGYVAYWDEQLSEKWKGIPDNAKTKVLLSEYCYAKICLHDSCLEPFLLASPTSRLRIAHSCIAALKAFNSAVVLLYEDPHTLLDIPFHSFARANHSMFVALQLCSLDCGAAGAGASAGLSAEMVERELGLVVMFSAVAEKAEALVEGSAVGSVPAYHRRIVPMARAIQQGIRARLGIRGGGGGGGCDEGEISNIGVEGGGIGGEGVDGLAMGSGGFGDFEPFEQFLGADDELWLQRLLAADDSQGVGSGTML